MLKSKLYEETPEGFKCLKCGEVFKQKDKVYRHNRKVHKKAEGRQSRKGSGKGKREVLPVLAAVAPKGVVETVKMGTIRHCMNCGAEIPVGVILRQEG